jgi:hypothetical protein
VTFFSLDFNAFGIEMSCLAAGFNRHFRFCISAHSLQVFKSHLTK